MSEMLGKHYFMVRKFENAAREFERSLNESPDNKAIRKKLIVCYVRQGRVEEALAVFIALIKEDIDCVINTDLQADDCPCPEIIDEIENNPHYLPSEGDFHASLGMMWLYCDLRQSVKQFEAAAKFWHGDSRIGEVLGLLKQKLNQIHPRADL